MEEDCIWLQRLLTKGQEEEFTLTLMMFLGVWSIAVLKDLALETQLNVE